MDERQEMFTMRQVQKHETEDDFWLVIHGKVYDLTNFLEDHPGGSTILLPYGGGDATYSFELWNHGQEAQRIMKKICVGKVCENPGENAPNPHGGDEGRAPKRTRKDIWDYNTNSFHVDEN